MKEELLMFRKTLVTAISAALVLALLTVTALTGCGGEEPAAVSSEPSEVVSDTGRQDGERFESVIMLEGMAETIRCEHVRNEKMGFELDFDYDVLERNGEAIFVSRFDELEKPENYLEAATRKGDADTVAASVKKNLKKSFKTVKSESYTLERAGECTRLSASDAKKGNALQTVYVIPANDGCLIVTVHCTMESAEGYGARFDAMVNTISIIG